jgi:hypothetical protein
MRRSFGNKYGIAYGDSACKPLLDICSATVSGPNDYAAGKQGSCPFGDEVKLRAYFMHYRSCGSRAPD